MPLIHAMRRSKLSRREVLARATAIGLVGPAMLSLLAACRGDDESNSTPVAANTPGVPDSTPPADPTATASPSPTPDSAATATPLDPLPLATGLINIAVTIGDSSVGNPILPNAIPQIEAYVFSRLVTCDDRGHIQPELAHEWAFSDDHLTLTLQLVEASWHDGEAFTADDVIFTLDTIENESTGSPKRALLRANGEVIRWEKVDDRTVTFSLQAPFAPLLFHLSQIPIIPEHILSGSAEIISDPFNTAPIGTGAYKLDEWAPGEHVVLAANAEYFNGQPRNDGLRYVFFASSEAAAAAFDDGMIDMLYAPMEIQSRYEGVTGATLHPYVYYTPISLAFNHQHPLLGDIAVRQAIAAGIDKSAIVEAATEGRGTVAYNQFAEGGPLDAFNDYDNVRIPTYDVDAANQMLEEAGHALGSDGIRVSPGGDRFSFTLLTYSGFPEYEIGQSLLAEMLREIGIEILTQIADSSTLDRARRNPNADPENRALELQEWPHPPEFDPDLYAELHSDNFPPGGNAMWFADPQVDEMIELGRATVDQDKRVAIYRELDVRRSETLPNLPLYNAVDAWVVSERVSGVAESPYFRRYVLTNAPDWTKEA